MPARQLPDHPSLRHLRNEAKALRRSVREKDGDAIALVRTHLRRLREMSAEQIIAADVTLQDIQYALACDYGLSGWSALIDVVEPDTADFGVADLARLSSRDAEIAVRTIDRRDLIHALLRTDERLTTCVFASLSPREAKWVRDERVKVACPQRPR